MNPFYVLGAVAIGGVLLSSKKAFAYVGGQRVEVDLVDIGNGHMLERHAANSFQVMKAAAKRDGILLNVNSAFRSMEEQSLLWQKYQNGTGNLAARPGYSNHQSGIALDLDVDATFTSATYKWLNEHAGVYDWVNTGRYFSQKEPWHWEYKP